MARFKQEDFKQEPLAMPTKSVLDDVEIYLNGNNDGFDEEKFKILEKEIKSGFESLEASLRKKENEQPSFDKVELFIGFTKDLEVIGSDLKEELESHKDADKGGDILDDVFLNKILIKYENRLEKLSDEFAEKVKKSYESIQAQLNIPSDSGGSAGKAIGGGLAVAVLTGILLATIPVTTTSFLIFATTTTLAGAVGGVVGTTAGVVTGGAGAVAGVAAGITINKKLKKKFRRKRIDKTLEEFDKNVKPKYWNWAKDLLQKY